MRDRVHWIGRCVLGMVLAGVFALQPGPVAADAWEGLAEAAHSDLVTTGFRDSLARFYAERRDRPLWFASVRPSAPGLKPSRLTTMSNSAPRARRY